MSDEVRYRRVVVFDDHIPVIDIDKELEPLLGAIKAVTAAELKLEEVQLLVTWCSFQDSNLWDTLSLQEILNVYRATIEWDTFEDWAESDWKEAYAAWDAAVIDPENKMSPRY